MTKQILLSFFLIIGLVGCGGGSTKQDDLKISGEYLKAYNNYLDREDKGFENTKSIILNNKDIDLISENDKEIIFSINGVKFLHINTDIANSLPATPSLFSEEKARASIVTTKNKRSSKKQTALVLQPFYSNSDGDGNWYGSGDTVARFIHKLADEHFNVTYLRDRQVTLEVLKTIGNYDLVYILTHGSEDGTLISGEVLSKEEIKNYPNLVIGNEGRVGVRPSFFSQIPGTLKTKVFVANACNSSFTNTLSNTLFKKGVDVFIGWNDFTVNDYIAVGDYYLDKLYSQCAPLRTITESAKQDTIEKAPKINCEKPQRDCGFSKTITGSDLFMVHDIRRSPSTFGEDVYLNSSCLVPETEEPSNADDNFILVSNIVSGNVYFNETEGNVPSNTWVRIVPTRYQIQDVYSGVNCKISSNGNFGNECYIDTDRVDATKAAFSDSSETFQVIVYDDQNFDKYWNHGEKSYGFIGNNVANGAWTNFSVGIDSNPPPEVSPENGNAPNLSKYSLGGSSAKIGENYQIRFELQDLDGDIGVLVVHWGDGSSYDSIDLDTSTTSAFLKYISHTYDQPGEYTWEAHVLDQSSNASQFISQSVVVD